MSAEAGQQPSPPLPTGQRTHSETFVPEDFCDEVYDYIDDNLAEAMDDMERELVKAAAKAEATNQGQGISGGSPHTKALIKTCCDNMQKRLQKEFDRNIDIFDRYIKKNVASIAPSTCSVAPTGAAGAAESGSGMGGGGGKREGGGAGETGGDSRASRQTPGSGGGADGHGKGLKVNSTVACLEKRGASESADPWAFDADESVPPKRLKEEEALDAEIQSLRIRRREGLRRCAAMVRKKARDTAVLQDANDYVEALLVGVSSSFDHNGLTPVPTKVKEAVQSCAELRVTADRAQELTRQLELLAEESVRKGAGGKNGGGGAGSGGAPTVPPPKDLQEMFQRSSERVVASRGGYGILGAGE